MRPIRLTLLALGLLAPVATARAAGDVEFEATMEPARVAFPDVAHLTYRLEMDSGPTTSGRPFEFSVEARVPLYGASRRGEGAAFRITSARLEGDAVAGAESALQVEPTCSPKTDAMSRLEPPRYAQFSWHGYEPVHRGFEVELPPDSHGSFVVEAEAGAVAPWTTLDWRLPFKIIPAQPSPVDLQPAETVPAQTVRPPEDRVRTPRTGVQIVLKTDPPSAPAPFANPPEIARGEPIDIRGRTYPRLPGARIRLRYFGPDDGRSSRFRKLARVEVGRRGRFRYRGWRPDEPGGYELWAFYRSRRPSLVSDYSCPRVFTLR